MDASAVAVHIADLHTCLVLDYVAIGGSIGPVQGYLERVRTSSSRCLNCFAAAAQKRALFSAIETIL